MCPALPMAGQANPRPRGNKDMARKVRLPAPLPLDLMQRWAVQECVQVEVDLLTWVLVPWVPCHHLVHLEVSLAFSMLEAPAESPSEVWAAAGQ